MSEINLLPPHSQEAEEALIGSVIVNPEIYQKVDIETSDFYKTENQVIWQAIGELSQIDYITVTERLRAKNKLKLAGGPAYITGLINSSANSYHAEDYAKIVKDNAKRRGLLKLASDIGKAAYNKKLDIDTITPEFIQHLADVSRIKFGAEPISNVMSKLYDDVEEKAADPKDIWGIETGFPGFDRVTGGIQPGELIILSGEPGVGKSIFGMQTALQMGKKSPGVIYSLEMSSAQAARRLVSGEAKVSTRILKSGRLENNDWSKITGAIERISNLPIYISDSVGWTTTSLRADIARLKAQAGIEWFVLDYLYLLNDGSGLDEIARTQMAGTGLKRITKELKVAGLAIHSMNKAGIGSDAPNNSALRGSGQVIYDADLVLFLTQYKEMDGDFFDKKNIPNMRTLWFGKGRELENPKKYIHFVKTENFPMFAEAVKF